MLKKICKCSLQIYKNFQTNMYIYKYMQIEYMQVSKLLFTSTNITCKFDL